MPLTLRPKDDLLASILSSILAGGLVTDVAQISVLRQFCEGVAATQADLDYDLYTLLQGWYLSSAEGIDLDVRGLDYGSARDRGQAASDPVTFYAQTLWVDDIALTAPQVLQATLADGTTVLYRSLGDQVLRPSGRSVSGPAPGTTLTGGTNDAVSLNLDSDGVRTVTLGSQTSAVAIAAALQAAVTALTALTPSHQTAYSGFRCDYGVTTPGAYTLRSGTTGPTSSVVVSVAASHDASHTLKLGLTQGGQESAGQSSLAVPVQADVVGVLGNVGAGQINQLTSQVPGIDHVANALMFSNGREPASDDAYRQDIRTHLDSLGRGNPASLERAVAQTVSADGARHVMSSQVTYGASTIQVFLCDGRSLTVGAQADVIKDVQDELDGLGSEPGGWVPSGNVAGVVSASVVTVSVDVDVYVGPIPDLASAQQAITNALYSVLYTSDVGQVITAVLLDSTIDDAVVEVFNIVYRQPLAFSLTPRGTVGGAVGTKCMPGTISVQVYRA